MNRWWLLGIAIGVWCSVLALNRAVDYSLLLDRKPTDTGNALAHIRWKTGYVTMYSQLVSLPQGTMSFHTSDNSSLFTLDWKQNCLQPGIETYITTSNNNKKEPLNIFTVRSSLRVSYKENIYIFDQNDNLILNVEESSMHKRVITARMRQTHHLFTGINRTLIGKMYKSQGILGDITWTFTGANKSQIIAEAHLSILNYASLTSRLGFNLTVQTRMNQSPLHAYILPLVAQNLLHMVEREVKNPACHTYGLAVHIVGDVVFAVFVIGTIGVPIFFICALCSSLLFNLFKLSRKHSH